MYVEFINQHDSALGERIFAIGKCLKQPPDQIPAKCEYASVSIGEGYGWNDLSLNVEIDIAFRCHFFEGYAIRQKLIQSLNSQLFLSLRLFVIGFCNSII